MLYVRRIVGICGARPEPNKPPLGLCFQYSASTLGIFRYHNARHQFVGRITAWLCGIAGFGLAICSSGLGPPVVDEVTYTFDACCCGMPADSFAAMTKDSQTIAVYDAKAAEYAKLVPIDSAPDNELRAFMAGVNVGGRVLDLGCGPGRIAGIMASFGYDVLAIDASEQMIVRARMETGVEARLATFDDVPGLGHFDGIWANFSLLHASHDDYPRHLADIHSALTPNGIFHIALKLGRGTQRDRLGRRYIYRDADTLHADLTSAGFTPFAESRGTDRGLDGTKSDWIAVLSRA
jgi:SAM-dependent methyltransferase